MKIFSFVFVVLTIVFFVSSAYTQELTEEQKRQLQQSIQEQTEKFKKSFEKINSLSEMQNQSVNSATGGTLPSNSMPQVTPPVVNQKPSIPRWDGIYVVDNGDNYKELKFLTKVSVRNNKSRLTGREYMNVYVLPEEISYIAFDSIKGFFLKGNKIIEKVHILLAKKDTSFLSGVSSFLSGMVGGQGLTVDEIDKNLYSTEFRCETETNSQYCEFINPDKIKNYLIKGDYCLLFITGTSPEEGGKAGVLCFK
ncbi:hypothetical protein [Thermodesulfovibrio yellowstonii]|uniref:Uncharacterized protein n=1 Tax=Thermodesulfovibrio yellowstonii TaxID=28262 RepID=A0A9W6GFT0_9BACT|nr:hypothetical protein [Thermodesulfovibrio islandicus]GLI54474.1 hypothetical protein TISLANDTSLP1_21670 [Thermodesulfovibrio islandicus]